MLRVSGLSFGFSTNSLRRGCQPLTTKDFASVKTRFGELPVKPDFLNPWWLTNGSLYCSLSIL